MYAYWNYSRVYKQEQKRQETINLIAVYEDKLKQLETKLREALEFYVNNTFSVEEYRDVKKRIDNDKKTILSELERLQIEAEEVEENKLEIVKSFKENWDKLSNKEKRMFLMQFVEKIVVENEKLGKGHTNKKVKIFDIEFK